MMKLAAGTLEQSCAELVSDLMGMAGCAWDASDPDGDIGERVPAPTMRARSPRFLAWSTAATTSSTHRGVTTLAARAR